MVDIKLEERVSAPSPDGIFLIAAGFMTSKTLFTGVKLGLFTFLGSKRLTAEEIRVGLNLHELCVLDFLDTLLCLRLLNRDGVGKEAVYSNTSETALFLDKSNSSYIGGILEFDNDHSYLISHKLEEALKTAKPQGQSEKKDGAAVFEEDYYGTDTKLIQFMNAMASLQGEAFRVFASKFDFKPFNTHCDVGGATGILSIKIAQQNPHIQSITYDLKKVERVAKEWIERYKVEDNVKVVSGDFFNEPLPKADIITMGNILHDWNEDSKLKLVKEAYDALSEGGAFVAIESFIDDERRTNLLGLIMSLSMRVEFGDAYNFSFADFQEMCKKIGFTQFELLPLTEGTQAAIAYKNKK
mmetsp:Transcript_65975/g.76643  ORF Transcript_65975/g.76643 Transcript_65975/m.76643 type:complete len:355 (-) Transcript_65975:143-1207(-)